MDALEALDLSALLQRLDSFANNRNGDFIGANLVSNRFRRDTLGIGVTDKRQTRIHFWGVGRFSA
jgi:hypothetical protein